MQQEVISPDCITLVYSSKPCSNIGNIIKGQEMHADIIKKGLENDTTTVNTLIEIMSNVAASKKLRMSLLSL